MKREQLTHELIELDRRESRSKSYNRYAIAHYLRAADEVLAMISNGEQPEIAFAENFNPTRGMHTVAKRLSLNLDVQHGRWVWATQEKGGK